MSKKAFDKIAAGLNEALDVARGKSMTNQPKYMPDRSVPKHVFVNDLKKYAAKAKWSVREELAYNSLLIQFEILKRLERIEEQVRSKTKKR